MKVIFLTLLTTLFSNIQCQMVSNINLGAIIVTQNGFTDAPERYAVWVQQAVDEANKIGPSPNPYWFCHGGGKCCEHFTETMTSWLITVNPANDMTITITETGIRIHVITHIIANGNWYYRDGGEYYFFGHHCLIWLKCGTNSYSASGTVSLTANVNIIWNGETVSIALASPITSNADVQLHTNSYCADLYSLYYNTFCGSRKF